MRWTLVRVVPLGAAIAWGICAAQAAAPAVGWRVDGTGRVPAADPATDWEDPARVVWRTELPAESNASPVAHGDRIFVCAEPDTLLCLDRRSGEILWQHTHGYLDLLPESQREEAAAKIEEAGAIQRELRGLDRRIRQARRRAGDSPSPEAQAEIDALRVDMRAREADLAPLEAYRLPVTHTVNGYSSATPVTDGSRVFVFFGTGVAAAYDVDGSRLWARKVEKPTHAWGHSASPVLAGGRLVIHVRDVHGLDPATGETLWTVPSRARWGASVAAEIGGEPVVITANGEILMAEDGRVLASGLHALDYNAPLVHDGIVYFIEHGGRAFRLPGRADGSEPPVEIWRTTPPNDRYYASPLYHDGHIYAVTRAGVYSVIDAGTGEVLYSVSLEGLRRTVYPSVTLAGDRIFLGSEGGNFLFLEPGAEGREVASGRIEGFRTTPVFDGRRVWIRTLSALVCLGDE